MIGSLCEVLTLFPFFFPLQKEERIMKNLKKKNFFLVERLFETDLNEKKKKFIFTHNL